MSASRARRRKAARHSGAPGPIRFGTSGWRGILGEEITFRRLRAALRGASAWLIEQRSDDRRRRVLVGYDGRFASERMARMATAMLRAEGLSPQLSAVAVPTPVVSSSIPIRRAIGALVFTASHNPAAYHGMKVFGETGSGIDDAGARRLERLAAQALRGSDADYALPHDRGVDLVGPYLERLVALLDRRALRRADLRVVYDAMHGVGAGVLDEALRRCGASVVCRRGEPDPLFGGGAPDPTGRNLEGLVRAVRAGRGLRVGLATDGDADRIAVADGSGGLLSETQTVALLVDHLARTGRIRRGVAISVATGSLVERVAAEHGLHVERFPIGFKHLSRALATGGADAAGEESGGFALEELGRDKDGILSGCLVAECVAMRGPLAALVRDLERRHGRCACGRRAVPADAVAAAGLARLLASPPASVGRTRVRSVATDDGLRLGFDDGFLMWRASGTEPVLRIYAEARDPHALASRLERGARLLSRAGRRSG